MKVFSAATIRQMAEVLISKDMLPVITILCIHLVKTKLNFLVNIMPLTPILICACARKIIVIRIIHHRKFAVFPIYPDSRAGLSG